MGFQMKNAVRVYAEDPALPLDYFNPEEAADEKRVAIGKLRHQPGKRFVALTEIADDCGTVCPIFVHTGLTTVEMIAMLLGLQPNMVYTIYWRAASERQTHALHALVSAMSLLNPETKREVLKEARNLPSDAFTRKMLTELQR